MGARPHLRTTHHRRYHCDCAHVTRPEPAHAGRRRGPFDGCPSGLGPSGMLLAAAALATGAAVAVSGTIAFVGLVTPHILRLVLGPDHRVLIPMSAAGGAVFVIVADTVARTIVQPAEFRVGVLTAFVGAPFFIVLLIKNKRQAYSL